MRAMRQAEMLLKLKRIKRQFQNIKHTHLVIHIQWERERERERERLKNLRPSTGAMRGRSPERWEAEHRSDEIEKPTAASTVYRGQTEHRSDERPISDLPSAMTGERRRRRRSSCGVAATWPWVCWGLNFICVLAISFFFFLNKNLCFSVFLSVALSVCLVHWVLSLVCCWELECWVWFAL